MSLGVYGQREEMEGGLQQKSEHGCGHKFIYSLKREFASDEAR